MKPSSQRLLCSYLTDNSQIHLASSCNANFQINRLAICYRLFNTLGGNGRDAGFEMRVFAFAMYSFARLLLQANIMGTGVQHANYSKHLFSFHFHVLRCVSRLSSSSALAMALCVFLVGFAPTKRYFLKGWIEFRLKGNHVVVVHRVEVEYLGFKETRPV